MSSVIRGSGVCRLYYLWPLVFAGSTLISMVTLYAMHEEDGNKEIVFHQLLKGRVNSDTQSTCFDTGFAGTLMRSMGLNDRSGMVSFCTDCISLCQDSEKAAVLGLGVRILPDLISKGFGRKNLVTDLGASLKDEGRKADCICVPLEYLPGDMSVEVWNYGIIQEFANHMPDQFFHQLCSFIWLWVQQYQWLTGKQVGEIDELNFCKVKDINTLQEAILSREQFLEELKSNSFNFVKYIPEFYSP